MSKFGHCFPCHEKGTTRDATMILDGDPHCNSCASKIVLGPSASTVAEPKARKVEMCSRGCGEENHRGLCKGAKLAPRKDNLMVAVDAADAATAVRSVVAETLATANPEGNPRSMDTLVAREIDLAEVPNVTATRPPTGRLGQIWTLLLATAPGKALEVKCRDRVHIGTTDRCIREKAKAAGLPIGSRKALNLLYLWKVEAKSGVSL